MTRHYELNTQAHLFLVSLPRTTFIHVVPCLIRRLPFTPVIYSIFTPDQGSCAFPLSTSAHSSPVISRMPVLTRNNTVSQPILRCVRCIYVFSMIKHAYSALKCSLVQHKAALMLCFRVYVYNNHSVLASAPRTDSY